MRCNSIQHLSFPQRSASTKGAEKPLGLLPWNAPQQVGPTETQPHVTRFGSSPTISTEQRHYTSGSPNHKEDIMLSSLWLA